MSKDYKDQLKTLLNHLRQSEKAASGKAAIRQDPPKTPNTLIGDTQSHLKSNSTAASTSSKSLHQNDGSSAGASPQRPAQANLEITLGIDFGTRFTKVAAFLRQTGQYKILPLGGQNSSFLQSWILTDASENVYPPDLPPKTAKTAVEYLKMHLAKPDGLSFGGYVRIEGHSLQTLIEPLCAFYLAGVLRRSIALSRQVFANDGAQQRKIDWFANVGVPVQHCDGDELVRFQRVAAVAWQWKDDQPRVSRAADLIERYNKGLRLALPATELPIQVVPELAAALAHFVERRTTPEGMYAFFDIGGGTLDGTAFHLTRTNRGPEVNILSAIVDDVGTMAVSREAVRKYFVEMNTFIEHPLIFGSSKPRIDLPIDESGHRVQVLFNKVVRLAKRQMPTLEFSSLDKPGLKTYSGPGKYIKYPVLMAGGGARSQWYADLFRRTAKDFAHHQVGLGECDVKLVPPPPGFSGDEYPRFVVAIGLTADSIHDGYKMPSKSAPIPSLEEFRPKTESPISKDYV